ncbi:hypothetical protein EV356DRAFT_445254 [Viridothelium virens]|uniref:Integral membrane protein n=1 Tax=Viridothelium virens TaxID=1048519 RepID=A0A6A6HB12_VIRVR|nr:hypothetical protein EV356DRAFT_445254 [Viridothelium virens]
MLSTLPYLEYAASFYATIFIGFGIMWFVNPPMALSFFELPYPQASSKGSAKNASTDAKKTMDAISVVYGVRDAFMGAAIYAAAFCGTREALGWIVIAAACVAATDGAVCKFMVGKGEMNHWSYAPVMLALGGVMLGAFDWIPLDRVFSALS